MERAAPGPGAVLAERLWCRLPRGRVAPPARFLGRLRARCAPRSAAMLTGLSPAEAGERFRVRVGAGTVTGEVWGAGPTVYLLHGWGGWRGQWDAFVPALVAGGHRVVAFDAPGHGESPPGPFGAGRGLLTDLIEGLEAVVALCGRAHAVVGHSLGGTAAAVAVLDGLRTGRLALVSPMADPTPYTVEFARMLGFGERIRTGFLRRLERRVDRPMGDFDVPARARARLGLPPLLVLHDRRDREVRHADGAAIAEAWPGGEFHGTDGLGHRRILRDPSVVRAVAAFTAPPEDDRSLSA